MIKEEYPSHCAHASSHCAHTTLSSTLSLETDWAKCSENKNLPFAPLPVRTLPDHKTFSSLPNGCCRPHLSLCTDQKHSKPRHTCQADSTNLIFAGKKVPDFLLPTKSELFLFLNSGFLNFCLPKNCSGNLAARRAKSLSKANNKFEEHTLGQFTQPDFTFKPWKVNYSTFLNFIKTTRKVNYWNILKS